MCSRYHMDGELLRELEKGWIDPETEKEENADFLSFLSASHDVCPSMKAPVLIHEPCEAPGKFCLREYRWGFPGVEGKGLVINARCETALEKKMFAESVEKRRCLIPASGFYEWSERKDKYFFTPKRAAGTEGGLLMMAGFYRKWEGEEGFVILTTRANASVSRIHPRMPLILGRADAEKWLEEGCEISAQLEKEPEELEREQLGQLSLFG